MQRMSKPKKAIAFFQTVGIMVTVLPICNQFHADADSERSGDRKELFGCERNVRTTFDRVTFREGLPKELTESAGPIREENHCPHL